MHASMFVQGLEPDIEQMRRQHKDDLRHATQQAQEMAKYVHHSAGATAAYSHLLT